MINKAIQKITGKPKLHDGSSIGTGTKAAQRPAKNSNIAGGKFLGACSMYGTEGVGSAKGSGGKASARHKSSFSDANTASS